LESAVTSIYPGVLAIRPPNEVAKSAELLLAYGDAEYRWPDGRRYVTPVGEIQGDASALFRVLAATSREGEKRIRITAKSEATS
jgi:hypothetical protein